MKKQLNSCMLVFGQAGRFEGFRLSKITCEYFEISPGKMPVKEFIEALDASTRRKFYFTVDLLREFGHRLGEPHAKYFGNSIFELRFMGREGAVRILYFFFHQNKAIFTNGFLKKTNGTPERELESAVKRRRYYNATHP